MEIIVSNASSPYIHYLKISLTAGYKYELTDVPSPFSSYSSSMDPILYGSLDKKFPNSSTFPHLSYSVSCQLFFFMSSSTCLNPLVLGHLIGLFPLNFISDTLLGILILAILFTWLNRCIQFSCNSINKFCIPASLNINF
jgi:hypothetical protein